MKIKLLTRSYYFHKMYVYANMPPNNPAFYENSYVTIKFRSAVKCVKYQQNLIQFNLDPKPMCK